MLTHTSMHKTMIKGVLKFNLNRNSPPYVLLHNDAECGMVFNRSCVPLEARPNWRRFLEQPSRKSEMTTSKIQFNHFTALCFVTTYTVCVL